MRAPNEENPTKLVHLMQYIRGMCTLLLTPSANGGEILKWWLDALFSVHTNVGGHSGGGLSLVHVFPIVRSTKQKLNTKSSTNMEISGVDDFMSAICWTWYFFAAQCYNVKDGRLHQDNKSSILVENIGKASSSNWKKHINIRYFFLSGR